MTPTNEKCLSSAKPGDIIEFRGTAFVDGKRSDIRLVVAGIYTIEKFSARFPVAVTNSKEYSLCIKLWFTSVLSYVERDKIKQIYCVSLHPYYCSDVNKIWKSSAGYILGSDNKIYDRINGSLSEMILTKADDENRIL